MLLLRSCRVKTRELKAISRHFSSLPKSHQTKNKYESYFSKLPGFLSPRFHRHLIGFQYHYSTEWSNTAESSDASNAENSSNTPSSLNVEHPEVANYSEEDAEQYRKDNNILVTGENIPPPIRHFSELPLPEVVKDILRQENYSKPTAIQSQGWPVAFSGRDMVGVSQTGSGKTLAYMLPAVVHASNLHSRTQKRDRERFISSPKILVLGPTRELVQQILQVSKRYIQASYLKGACVYGGASKGPQLNQLQGAEICIATPGRLLDYLDNRETSLKNCTYLVLDEADRMLDMGFEPQIREIINHIPNERQTLMWSATWPKEIKNLAEDFLNDYIHITVGDTELVANPNIQQNIYVVDERDKYEKFLSFVTDIMNNERNKMLVFAETKKKVDYLTDRLTGNGIKAWGIHGDCTQNKRDRILRDFRRSPSSILIATDIASRGLDITDIHHVFNYDFPTNIEDYIHRIGRTARGSACGESHSFFTPDNVGVLKDLLSVLKKANQEINPELYTLLETIPNKFSKAQRQYNYNTSSYGKNRNWKESFGKRMPFGKNRFGNERSRYNNEKSRYNNDRSRNMEREEWAM